MDIIIVVVTAVLSASIGLIVGGAVIAGRYEQARRAEQTRCQALVEKHLGTIVRLRKWIEVTEPMYRVGVRATDRQARRNAKKREDRAENARIFAERVAARAKGASK